MNKIKESELTAITSIIQDDSLKFITFTTVFLPFDLKFHSTFKFKTHSKLRISIISACLIILSEKLRCFQEYFQRIYQESERGGFTENFLNLDKKNSDRFFSNFRSFEILGIYLVNTKM